MKKWYVFLFKVLVAIVSILLLFLWTKKNIEIAKEAKTIEDNNKQITYSYDDNNTVPEDIIPAQLVTERLSPSSIKKIDDEWLLSFENTYFGTLEISFDKPLDVQQNICVILSEKETIDGHAWTRLDATNDLNGFGLNYYSDDVIIPKGVTEYRLVIPERPLPIAASVMGGWDGGVLPFCAATIRGLDVEEGGVEFRQISVHAAFDENNSSFVSDNELLNEIYAFCKDTIKATTYAGVYVDGYRELRPYEADAFINELGHFSVDDNYDIDKVTLEYLIDHHTWPTEWRLQTIPLAYEYYMYSGDKEFLEAIFPQLESCLMSELKNGNGLVDSTIATEDYIEALGVPAVIDIVDWPQIERDNFAHSNNRKARDILVEWGYRYKQLVAEIVGCRYASVLYRVTADGCKYENAAILTPNAVVNAFYYHSLKLMAELANDLGLLYKRIQYNNEAEEFRIRFQNSFIDKKTRLVKDSTDSEHSSLHANMFALDFGLIPDENVPDVISFIKSKGMACSVYGSQYLLEALVKYNEDDYALSLIESKDKKSWYNMMYETGSKLATEAWDEDIKPDMDWNHAWGTAPVNILTRYIVGVRPCTAGYESAIFSPHFGNLEDVYAKVPTKKGQITIHYSKTGKTVLINIQTPVDTIIMAQDKAYNVSVNGNTVTDDDIWIEPGSYTISYEILGE